MLLQINKILNFGTPQFSVFGAPLEPSRGFEESNKISTQILLRYTPDCSTVLAIMPNYETPSTMDYITWPCIKYLCVDLQSSVINASLC